MVESKNGRLHAGRLFWRLSDSSETLGSPAVRKGPTGTTGTARTRTSLSKGQGSSIIFFPYRTADALLPINDRLLQFK